MRKLIEYMCVLPCLLLISCSLSGQTTMSSESNPLKTKSDLRLALLGDWIGVLEYRDYSEPAGSTKRETLPTWLSIGDAEPGKTLRWRYIYDDGPTKVVEENDVVNFDPIASSFTEMDSGKPAQSFEVTGYETLRSGYGTLVLMGAGTDNNRPAVSRLTMRIDRNLIDIVEETRPAGTHESFVFRHAYRLTRATPPQPGR